jgi:Zinc finger, C2H2 type
MEYADDEQSIGWQAHGQFDTYPYNEPNDDVAYNGNADYLPIESTIANYEPSFIMKANESLTMQDMDYANAYNQSYGNAYGAHGTVPNVGELRQGTGLYNIPSLPLLPTVAQKRSNNALGYDQGNPAYQNYSTPLQITRPEWMAMEMGGDNYQNLDQVTRMAAFNRQQNDIKKSGSNLSINLALSAASRQYIITAEGYMCIFPGCDKVFEKQNNLKSHLKTHADARNFQCNECTATFRRSHDLKRHQRSIHSEVKPFTCIQCGKGFSRQVYICDKGCS